MSDKDHRIPVTEMTLQKLETRAENDESPEEVISRLLDN
jgi:hypothetical protein